MGATSEIGRETGRVFAESGSSLLLVGRRGERLNEVGEICSRYNVRVRTLQADLTVKGVPKQVIEAALEAFGRVDVLVSYVGYQFKREIWFRELHELDEELVTEIFRADFLSSFSAVREVIPVMRRSGGGTIILTTSTPAVSWHVHGAAYTFAKSAIISLVRSIAAENGRYNIRSYALALGNIRTSITYDSLDVDERRRLAEESPMRRWGEPEEVAKVALALATDAFSFVNGQTIVIDGGTVMS